MNKLYPFLKDKQFLKELDSLPLQEIFIKINLLTWDEKVSDSLEGIATAGTLNLNGDSSIRRTCNLTLGVEEKKNNFDEIKNKISLNRKVGLEIGYTQPFANFYNEYFNDYSETNIGNNITIQPSKNKKIWLPLGIFVISSASFSHSVSNCSISLQLKDKMCLLNGECGGTFSATTTLHEYDTLSPDGEIIISKPTIFQIIQEMVNHWGKEDLNKIFINDLDLRIKQVMKWTGENALYQYEDGTLSVKEFENKKIIKTFETGDDIGFIYSDFYYPGELIAQAGDTVVTILDKIKNTLGNFEYYYDVFGNFIFQEKKNYLNTSYSTNAITQMNKKNYLIDITRGKNIYTFNDGQIISSFSNSPQYNNIKNDFIVWGIRETPTGQKLPFRYHLAIDKKPSDLNKYEDIVFYIDEDTNLEMAKKAFQDPGSNYQEGLIYQDNNKYFIFKNGEKQFLKDSQYSVKNIISGDWRDELYFQGIVSENLSLDSNDYYVELKNEWPKLFETSKESVTINKLKYYKRNFKEDVKKHPEDLDFFLDFIDSSTMEPFSIKNIGKRTKVINDDKVNCMFEKTVPNYIILNIADPEYKQKLEEANNRGENILNVSSAIYSQLSIGGTQNSAFEQIKNLLFEYTNYNESIQIQCLPIYHLEPNTLIEVNDIESDIHGEYFIKSISLPLNATGTMNINAVRAIDKL